MKKLIVALALAGLVVPTVVMAQETKTEVTKKTEKTKKASKKKKGGKTTETTKETTKKTS